MKRAIAACFVALVLAASSGTSAQSPTATIQMAGLTQPVEIIRDQGASTTSTHSVTESILKLTPVATSTQQQ